jgi:exonuclease VII small subunit
MAFQNSEHGVSQLEHDVSKLEHGVSKLEHAWEIFEHHATFNMHVTDVIMMFFL